MQIEVQRIYWNDTNEITDIYRRKKLYLDDIVSIEESLRDPIHTEITLSDNSTILINEQYDAFGSRLIELKKELDEEERNKRITGGYE